MNNFKNKLKNLKKIRDVSEKKLSLVEKMRPKELNDCIGQNHLIESESLLYNLLKTGVIPSMILWGPPGCGKTSLVNIIIEENKKLSKYPIKLIELSAKICSINDVKNAVLEAQNLTKQGIHTVVFMDEIHKFNKLQQDIFLPHVEAGTFILIGCTTENPSSCLNSALLSRCRIFILKKLQKDHLVSIIFKAIQVMGGEIELKTKRITENKPKTNFFIKEEVIECLAELSDGDGRVALNILEMAVEAMLSKNYKNKEAIYLQKGDIEYCLSTMQVSNIKQSDSHYHMHSALHHCIIMDDDNAALYWLARIIDIGEDPVYIAKKLVKIASEDIDFDDDDAQSIAVHTMQACQMIGMPESDVLLAQCVVYLSRAEKSKEVLDASIKFKSLIENCNGPQPKIPSFIKGLDHNNTIYQENINKSHLPEGIENINFFY